MNYKKQNRWVISQSGFSDSELARITESIASSLSLSLPTARLLVNRGCATPEAARRFIGKEEEQLYDPYLMKDMDVAVDRIVRAVESGEKIMIYGDYDVDGVTSVTSLYLYLSELDADISYHIPCRMTEGYGMSSGAIDKMAEDGIGLIITVDTGITAVGEVEHANSLGIDVIVTDHHECHETMPNAVAVVNPRRPDCGYPFDELAGVGVVFKLICAVEMRLGDAGIGAAVRRVAAEYCDLVALGTIADVMPVVDENRLIVSYGLSLMENGSRLSVSELIAASGQDSRYAAKKKITAAYVGFTLAPRINAAGRIKDASIAVELLLSDTRERARRYAAELCAINKERQQEENRITEEAYAKIEGTAGRREDPVIVLDDEKWHHGIIGIVASRISEKYHVPSILISFDGCGEEKTGEDLGKGSGRSVKGLNLVEALSSCSDILHKYGGHELAAGLTVKRKNLDALRARLNEYALNNTNRDTMIPTVEAECVLEPRDISIELARELFCLEPFGTSNPVPVFMTKDLRVAEVVPIGGGKHIRMTLTGDSLVITAMCFRSTARELDIFPGDTVDVMYTLDINEYQGVKTLQMIVKDIRLSSELLKSEIRAHRLSECLFSGALPEDVTDEERRAILPDRDDFAAVYNTLRRELRTDERIFTLRGLSHILTGGGYDIPYVKLKNIIMVFRELNLIGVDEIDRDAEIYSFRYIYVKNKTPLEKSNLYKRLKGFGGDN